MGWEFQKVREIFRAASLQESARYLKRASGRDIWKEKVEKDNQRVRCGKPAASEGGVPFQRRSV